MTLSCGLTPNMNVLDTYKRSDDLTSNRNIRVKGNIYTENGFVSHE